jgi:hypothetical protein
MNTDFFLSVINQKPSLLTARCSGLNTGLYLKFRSVSYTFISLPVLTITSVPKKTQKTLTKTIEEAIEPKKWKYIIAWENN